MRKFNEWLSTMRESINEYTYYTDFNKVVHNVDEMKIELNILNAMVGSSDAEKEFREIIERYPTAISAVPILIANRENEIYAMDDETSGTYDFSETLPNTIDEYCVFMRKTGLFWMMENHIISSIVDYVTGIEVGLDTNARKNRGGHQMENLLESFIKNTGFPYYKEIYARDVEEKWDLNLSRITNGNDAAKRFDFVVDTGNCIYAFETNFYNSTGSKLNETARSFKMIAEESKFINNFRFIWVTDGINGWKNARNNLRETYDVLHDLYDITDLENGILKEILK